MRLACLQFNPSLGKVKDNIQHANDIIAAAAPNSLDLLMLPELAFSGYNHPSLPAIAPLLEPTTAGPSTDWAVSTARRLRCHVSVGYPEITSDLSPRRYNSVVLVSPEGQVLVNYRKAFLYYTDETWADEGDGGFYAGNIGGLGNISMGICMDLNPYRFIEPWDAYEFSNHVLANSSSLVIMTMAWLTSPPSSDPAPPPPSQSEAVRPHVETVNYWLDRLKPLIDARHERTIVVALCNRCGVEGTATYAGSSTILTICQGRIAILGVAGKADERLLVIDTAD